MDDDSTPPNEDLAYRPMAATAQSSFNDDFLRELYVLQDAHHRGGSWDLLFLAFLRAAEQFGYFRLGPVVIDVAQVEVVVAKSGDKTSNDYADFSRVLMRQWKASGRPRLDQLHFLFAFMRCGKGIPSKVFGELAVTPEAVEEWLRRPAAASAESSLLTPEEVADYLKVHVETVRHWIRSGRLPAFRLGGLRALRIRRSDIDALLLPLESTNSNPEHHEAEDHAALSD